MSTVFPDQHLLEDLLSDLSAYPNWLIKCFRETFKLRAKSLHRVLSTDHPVRLMRVQEAIAQALGFANTHDLQEAISSIREIENEHDISNQRRWVEENRQSLSRFLLVYRLKGQNLAHEIDPYVDSPFLNTLTLNLAHQLGLPAEEVGRALRKAWTGSGPDGQLFGPNPLSFGIIDWGAFGGRVGRFDLDAEAALYLNDLLEEDEDIDARALDRPDREMIGRYWLEVTRQHPYFLEAFLRATDFIDDERVVCNVLSEGISYAERLIPKGYRGLIPYPEVENRPYIRALERRMRTYLTPASENFPKALADANKIDQRSIPKELGPYRMKCLLQALVKGDTPTTRSLNEKLLKRPESLCWMVGGLSLMLIDDAAGLDAVVAACLWSVDIERVLESSDPDQERNALLVFDRWADPKNLMPMVMVVLHSRPPLRRMIARALSDPIMAEARYKIQASRCEENHPTRQITFHDIPEQAREISRVLRERYPMPKSGRAQ